MRLPLGSSENKSIKEEAHSGPVAFLNYSTCDYDRRVVPATAAATNRRSTNVDFILILLIVDRILEGSLHTAKREREEV